jgi:hypothetical protein
MRNVRHARVNGKGRQVIVAEPGSCPGAAFHISDPPISTPLGVASSRFEGAVDLSSVQVLAPTEDSGTPALMATIRVPAQCRVWHVAA